MICPWKFLGPPSPGVPEQKAPPKKAIPRAVSDTYDISPSQLPSKFIKSDVVCIKISQGEY